jgi:hypothetical protein
MGYSSPKLKVAEHIFGDSSVRDIVVTLGLLDKHAFRRAIETSPKTRVR